MNWTEAETPDGLLHCRAGAPDRWDVAVSRAWPAPPVSRRRIARQIRQDVWRALRRTRGFIPRILVAFRDNRLYITAGGVLIAGRPPAILAVRIGVVLDATDNRRRWMAFAARRDGPGSGQRGHE